MGGFLLRGNGCASCFRFGLDAASASFDAISICTSGPLQVWLQANDGGAHGMASFDGAGISLTAHGAHSWHNL